MLRVFVPFFIPGLVLRGAIAKLFFTRVPHLYAYIAVLARKAAILVSCSE